ncbi:[Fe-Fe] hydrogenase large subunit C-terminal domain-containing protein [Alkaliphilus transvaalensis]|uniref:[Fe-Fe] hydrogenase large subunit C-terminal domain-containing protein n=1 Tax=Alkaliphilus transvaalensis TaxID=114628 RepID=UPI000550336A|nr:[Fe-Fe] hydrogenase large subunit C-terminal domain-containing protein [Alkaliphilus transvaalensis]
MHSQIHSIALDSSKCVGCTNCLKKCPTEAIRIKSGHSKIVKERCINCGQCIHACPRRARYGVTNSLESLSKFKYNIALVDPVLYGQFHDSFTPPQILNNILSLGFNRFFEISRAADLITEFTKEYLENHDNYPVISSSCPTIVRLIQIRFPELIDHILPIDSPVEISAYLARKKVMDSLGYAEADVGVFYISPCPARSFSFQKPVGIKKSRISGTFSVQSIFLEISKNFNKNEAYHPDFYPSYKGIGWAKSGGQSKSLNISNFLSVDGIENVISVLEEIEYHKIKDVSFVECHACTNGCIGGSLNIENSFVARNRIRKLIDLHCGVKVKIPQFSHEDFRLTESLKPLQVTQLDENISTAIQKMQQIEAVLGTLPNIDCGACGSPSCRALAEDIVLGFSNKKDCIVILKNQINSSE